MGGLAGILKVIKEGVPKPKQFRSPMPPMGGAQLSDTQASALAAYVWSLSHKPVSGNHPRREDISESITSTTDGRVVLVTITAGTRVGHSSLNPFGSGRPVCE